MRLKGVEELIMCEQFRRPIFGVDGRDGFELFTRESLQAFPLEIFEFRHPTYGRFHGMGAAFAAIDDPLENTHVVAEARPDELALLVGAEPVDAENMRTF